MKSNKMKEMPVNKLMMQMGIPMILSMALQAVMTQGLIQTLLVRLPLAYFMSIQPNASLTPIGLAALIATCVGILLNVTFYFIFSKKQNKA